MKCLTVTIDDKVLFSGEIAEYQYSESDQSVSVTARFTPPQSLLESLKTMAEQQRAQKASTDANASVRLDGPVKPNRALDVVRDNEE